MEGEWILQQEICLLSSRKWGEIKSLYQLLVLTDWSHYVLQSLLNMSTSLKKGKVFWISLFHSRTIWSQHCLGQPQCSMAISLGALGEKRLIHRNPLRSYSRFIHPSKLVGFNNWREALKEIILSHHSVVESLRYFVAIFFPWKLQV